jgi:hypothetical protein
MNYKKHILIGIILTLIGVVYASQSIDTLLKLKLCKYIYYDAGGYIATCFAYTISQILGPLSLSFFIILFPLYFLREEVYLAWRKFALWYLPIAAILLFIARPSGGGMSLGFDRESLTFHFSAYFALISILIMFIKSIKLRGK